MHLIFLLLSAFYTTLYSQLAIVASRDECKSSTSELRQAVERAALPTPSEWPSRRVVALTTMNLKGMKRLFPVFIRSVERTNFSSHLIVVSNGKDAYIHCVNLTSHHDHQCMLDLMCPPQAHNQVHNQAHNRSDPLAHHEDTSTFAWGSYLHWLSMMRRVEWARAVIQLDASVFWIEMDIFFLRNPFDFFFRNLPADVDVVVQSEYWDRFSAFKGNFCRIRGALGNGCRDRGCGDANCPAAFQPSYKEGDGPLDCCASPIPNVNGGQCLVHPTIGGKLMMDRWYSLVHEDYVVKGKMYNGTARMDQASGEAE